MVKFIIKHVFIKKGVCYQFKVARKFLIFLLKVSCKKIFKMKCKIVYLILLLINLCNCLEPITMGLTAAGLAALGYNYEYFYCMKIECCNKDYIPVNINSLRQNLRNKVYGQHIVIDNVVAAIRSHFDNIDISIKPLVMTFHGTPGTGKNYVSDIVAEAIYTKGLDSKYVHKFFGRSSFPSGTQSYKQKLVSDIISAVRACPKSLIIIDEIDKLPTGVLDALASLLDHHHAVQGVNFRQTVFIFLTNTAGISISNVLAKEMKNGVAREDTKLQTFENICKLAAFNTEGGLKQSDPIKASLIDHYIPFLPLEEKHIKLCIKKEFARLHYSPTEKDINEIIDQVTFEEVSGIFATSGCKTISKKVEILTAFRQ